MNWTYGQGDKALQECNLSTEPSVDCNDCISPGPSQVSDRVLALLGCLCNHGQSEKLIMPFERSELIYLAVASLDC